MHFLARDDLHFASAIGAERACVTVRYSRPHTLTVVPGSIGILRADAQVVDLPERFAVVSPDGERIQPSPGRRFVVTAETCNPFHALAEVE